MSHLPAGAVKLYENAYRMLPTEPTWSGALTSSWQRNHPAAAMAGQLMEGFARLVNDKCSEDGPHRQSGLFLSLEANRNSHPHYGGRHAGPLLAEAAKRGHKLASDRLRKDKHDASARLSYGSEFAKFYPSHGCLTAYKVDYQSMSVLDGTGPLQQSSPRATSAISGGVFQTLTCLHTKVVTSDRFLDRCYYQADTGEDIDHQLNLKTLFVALMDNGDDSNGRSGRADQVRNGFYRNTIPADGLWKTGRQMMMAINNYRKHWNDAKIAGNGQKQRAKAKLMELKRHYLYFGHTSEAFDRSVTDALTAARRSGGGGDQILKVLRFCFKGMNRTLLRLLLKMRIDYLRYCLNQEQISTGLSAQKMASQFWSHEARLDAGTVAFLGTGTIEGEEAEEESGEASALDSEAE